MIVVGSGGAKPAMVIAAVLLVLLAGLGLLFMSAAPSPASSAVERVNHALPVEVVALKAEPTPPGEDATLLAVERLETGRAPLLADLDGDGTTDIVVLAHLRQGERRWDAFAAFRGTDGELLWHVDAPEDARASVAAVVHGRLLLLTRTGQVLGHELAAGKQQWSTALGDRGLRFCAASEPDAVLVVTADERVLLLDVKTGKQTPTRPPATCGPVATDQEYDDHDPRDRSDARAPAGVLGVRCGSVRVMGSENFTVPDACRARAKFDPDRLGGLVAHALWQTPGGWLVIGVRDPGTHTPLVARVQGKALAWKADVPEGNPLLASEGGPSAITLAGDVIVAGYRLQTGSHEFLTAFALPDGKRLWHIDAPGQSIDRLAATPNQLLVYADGSLSMLDLKTGALQRTIAPQP